jgi:hypothetical protein
LGTPLPPRIADSPWWCGAHAAFSSTRDSPTRAERPKSAPQSVVATARDLRSLRRAGARPRSSLWHSRY